MLSALSVKILIEMLVLECLVVTLNFLDLQVELVLSIGRDLLIFSGGGERAASARVSPEQPS
jgi:hypothetical protein